MTWFVRASARIYSAILVLYPFPLRSTFGPEMAEAFAADLEDALEDPGHTRRLASVAGVWWDALSEIPGIAIPGRLANEALVAPAVSLVLHLALVAGFLVLATFASEGIPPGVVHGFLTLRGQ